MTVPPPRARECLRAAAAYGVGPATRTALGRLDLHWQDSQRRAAVMGLRDFDIQVHTAEGRRTVREAGATRPGRITATFEPVQHGRVPVVACDSNGHRYFRIVELEV
ncbi:hypothetical protein BAY59_15715 [Prauserella coralliicola]|nr:hypothetical protein BAY59_15715 [Prauserella coralliicola]